MKKGYSLLCLIFVLFIQSNLVGQALTWVKQHGNIGDSCETYATEFDNSGNIITFGQFHGTFDFDPGIGVSELTSVGFYDEFIQKLDNDGNLLWVKTIVGFENFTATPITIDADDNIYLIGDYSGVVDFDPTAGISTLTSIGSTDIAIVKLTSSGDFVWAKSIGGDSSDRSVTIVSTTTDLYVLGSYFLLSTVDFDPSLATYSITDTATNAVVKLDLDGNFIWVKAIGSPSNDYPLDITVDQLGNPIVLGKINYAADFDPGPDTLMLGDPAGGTSTYVLKLDALGNFIWAKAFVPTFDFGIDFLFNGTIVTDDQNRIFIASNFSDTVDFNPDPLVDFYVVPVQGLNDNAFLVQLDASGEFQWVNTYSTLRFGYTGLTTNGNAVFITGNYNDTLIITNASGSTTLNLVGQVDGFIQQLDLSGNTVSQLHYGGNGPVLIKAIDLNDLNEVVVLGTFEQSVDFDPSIEEMILTSISAYDFFISKLRIVECSNFEIRVDSVASIGCASNGVVTTSIAGGMSPYNYTWDNNLLLNDSILSSTLEGTHTLLVTDNNGCIDSVTVELDGFVFAILADLNANLIANEFRPGYESIISINAFNDGCLPATGQLILAYDPLLDFVSSNPAPTSQNGDTLIWDFTNITYDSAHITPQIVFNTSVLAVIGDTIDFTTIIPPIAGDADTTNNIKYYSSPVVNGYDPNIKSVYPVGKCDVGYIEQDQLLTYTVQFQNTGNSEAINLAIIDSLSLNLDLNTVRVVGKSHEQWTEVLPGNVLKFHFDNINLPDSTTNEPASHGYVIFEVKPVSTWLNQNTEIANLADIYFDFNPAIRTNEVSNLIFQNGDLETYNCLGAGVNENSNNGLVVVYPNPTSSDITIEFGIEVTNATLVFVDIQGKEVLRQSSVNGKQVVVELGQLTNGVYFLSFESENHSINEPTIKIIKTNH